MKQTPDNPGRLVAVLIEPAVRKPITLNITPGPDGQRFVTRAPVGGEEADQSGHTDQPKESNQEGGAGRRHR